MDSSSCSPLKSTFLYLNKWPQEIHVNAEMRHITFTSLNNITMSSLVFLPTDWYYESSICVQWGQEDPNPKAHSSSGKGSLPSFQLNGGPEGWDFPGATEQ